MPLRIVEDKPRRLPSKGWAEMIRKVYEVDPMVCPRCGGVMKVVSFLTEPAVVDRIIDHLKLTFIAAKPPPGAVLQELLYPPRAPGGKGIFYPSHPVGVFKPGASQRRTQTPGVAYFKVECADAGFYARHPDGEVPRLCRRIEPPKRICRISRCGRERGGSAHERPRHPRS